MSEKYQFTACLGDIVLMPNGVMGIINQDEIRCGGHFRIIRVYPFTNWLYRFFLILSGANWFYDEKINDLKPIHLARQYKMTCLKKDNFIDYSVVNTNPKLVSIKTDHYSFPLENILLIAAKEFPGISLVQLMITATDNPYCIFLQEKKS